jgi:hypothetical protein
VAYLKEYPSNWLNELKCYEYFNNNRRSTCFTNKPRATKMGSIGALHSSAYFLHFFNEPVSLEFVIARRLP